jgi:hypothetical protein
MAIKVGINGFGRIGRLVYRAIRERYDREIDVVGGWPEPESPDPPYSRMGQANGYCIQPSGL